MKPFIPIVAAFVVGLAGSTAVGMRHPAAAADSTATAAPAAKAAAPAATDSTAAETASSPADSAAAPVTRTAASPAPVDTAAHADTLVGATQRLAGVFAKLGAQDIAPIAEGMSDSALVPVLRRLGTAKAAEVIAALPVTRAKALRRLLLMPGRGTSP